MSRTPGVGVMAMSQFSRLSSIWYQCCLDFAWHARYPARGNGRSPLHSLDLDCSISATTDAHGSRCLRLDDIKLSWESTISIIDIRCS